MPTKIASSWVLIFALASFGKLDIRLLRSASRPGGNATSTSIVEGTVDCPIPAAVPCQIGGS